MRREKRGRDEREIRKGDRIEERKKKPWSNVYVERTIMR